MLREPIRAAFFDVDNTLLNAKSMFSFQSFYLDQWRPAHGLGGESFAAFTARLVSDPERDNRQVLNRLFYASYAGHGQVGVKQAAHAWFAGLLQQHGNALWIRSAIECAEQLRNDGYLLIAVSGSCPEILAPVISALAFDGCLATRLEAERGVLTGRITPPQMIGPGKAVAIREFAEQYRIDLGLSFACGDHITDLPMLECVGSVKVVAGDPELEQLAARRGWPILDSGHLAMQTPQMHV